MRRLVLRKQVEEQKAQQAERRVTNEEINYFVQQNIATAMRAMTQRVLNSLFNLEGKVEKGYLLIAFDIADSEKRGMTCLSNVNVKGSWPLLESIWEAIRKEVNQEEKPRVIIPGS